MKIIVLLVVLLSDPGDRAVFGVITSYAALPECLERIHEMERTNKEHADKMGCMQILKADRLGKGVKEAEAETDTDTGTEVAIKEVGK